MFHRLKREVQREMVKEWKETKTRMKQASAIEAKYFACSEKEKHSREAARRREINKERLKDYKEKKVSFMLHIFRHRSVQGAFKH